MRRRGLARRDLGDPAGAAADARRALAIFDGLASRSRRGVVRDRLLPCRLAGLAGVAGSGVSAGRAAPEADAAMDLLHQAVAMGFRNADAFRTEAALDPLRDRARLPADDDGPAMPDDPLSPSKPTRGGTPPAELGRGVSSPVWTDAQIRQFEADNIRGALKAARMGRGPRRCRSHSG